MVFDLVQKLTEDVSFECQRCERATKHLERILIEDPTQHILERYRVCESCKEQIVSDIEDHFWYDSVSETDFERLIEYLESVEEIECVYHDDYTAGDITVHTKYASSDVVQDACDHFGYKIHGFGVLRESETEKPDCFEDHGEIFMIFLVPEGDIEPIPDPIGDKNYSALDYVNENDRIFD